MKPVSAPTHLHLDGYSFFAVRIFRMDYSETTWSAYNKRSGKIPSLAVLLRLSMPAGFAKNLCLLLLLARPLAADPTPHPRRRRRLHARAARISHGGGGALCCSLRVAGARLHGRRPGPHAQANEKDIHLVRPGWRPRRRPAQVNR